MSDGRAESGDIVENPEPEADSELSGVSEAEGNEGEISETRQTDQPEDEFSSGSGDQREANSPEREDVRQAVGPGNVEGGQHESDSGQEEQVESDSVEGGQAESECVEGGQAESECVEGEEAEGVLPISQNGSPDSGSDSPEHQQSQSVHSDVVECELFEPSESQNTGLSANNFSQADLNSDSVSSPQLSSVVSHSKSSAEESGQAQNDNQVVNAAQLAPTTSHNRPSEESGDLASPEDESLEQESAQEDGQAPECDRDFNLGEDSAAVEEQEEEEDEEVESGMDSVEGCEGRAPGEPVEAMSEPSSGAGSEVNLVVTEDSPEDIQTQRFSDNPEEDVEVGVELSEDFSSVESDGQLKCAAANSGVVRDQTESHLENLTPSNSSHSRTDLALAASFQQVPTNNNNKYEGDGDYEDDLLSELDAALLSNVEESPLEAVEEKPLENTTEPDHESELSTEAVSLPNGLNTAALSQSPELKVITEQLTRMQQQVESSQKTLRRLEAEKRQQAEALATTVKERDVYLAQVQSLKSRNTDNLYLPQIKELEYTIVQQQNEIRGLKDKLSSHDNAAKRAVSSLQNELKVRVDQVTKMYEECVREKDSMVIKYAESEQKNIECRKMQEKLEAKIRESAKDRESMVNKVKAVKAEKNKAAADLEAKSAEMGQAVKELEKLRDALSSADVRIKWSQNKLKAELDAHKETKATLEKMNIKLKEAREETQQIRRDCQAIIKTYQESEEIKSNTLDKELKFKETELIIQRQERSDREELYQMTAQELESLKAKHKDALAELLTLRDKVKCVGEEVESKDGTLSQYQEKIQRLKEENKHLQEKTESLVQLQEDFNRAQEMIKTLDRDISDLMVSNKDLQQDMDGCRRRESELLDLTEKLSRKNAKLQSDNTNLNNQVVTLSSEAEKWKMEIQELETRERHLADSLAEEQKRRKEETESLTSQLEEKTKHMENYRQQMEDEKDLNKTLKRKHVSNVKDLTRQLQQARKRLEVLENHVERDTTSMGSRTSSNGSLNTMGENAAAQHNNANVNHNSSSSVSRPPSQEQEYPVITEQVEVDKQVLIERIVRLQKAHARKNEKLEFLDDHIHQLVDEIQKKNRIIQHYIMREEAGTLAPEYMDENKALLAKKGGIMASVYSTHQQDGAMTLDLSLEINKKLQSVLEDTLLKNITLKESLDTLGTEIARLSQENRKLQLTIQELPH